jgi:hypothetical protein
MAIRTKSLVIAAHTRMQPAEAVDRGHAPDITPAPAHGPRYPVHGANSDVTIKIVETSNPVATSTHD